MFDGLTNNIKDLRTSLNGLVLGVVGVLSAFGVMNVDATQLPGWVGTALTVASTIGAIYLTFFTSSKKGADNAAIKAGS